MRLSKPKVEFIRHLTPFGPIRALPRGGADTVWRDGLICAWRALSALGKAALEIGAPPDVAASCIRAACAFTATRVSDSGRSLGAYGATIGPAGTSEKARCIGSVTTLPSETHDLRIERQPQLSDDIPLGGV